VKELVHSFVQRGGIIISGMVAKTTSKIRNGSTVLERRGEESDKVEIEGLIPGS